jgi:hypothetical protein
MIAETINQLIEKAGIDLLKYEEIIEVELVDGEKVKMTKAEYEKLLKESEGLGEYFY